MFGYDHHVFLLPQPKVRYLTHKLTERTIGIMYDDLCPAIPARRKGWEREKERQRMAVELPMERIGQFCRRWKIKELWLFGSVLRGDYEARSDVDLMARFAPDTRMSLLDLLRAQNELSDMLGRPVDLVLREDIERSENWIRRKDILESAREIYVA